MKTQTPPAVLAVNLRQAAVMTGYSETTLRDAIYFEKTRRLASRNARVGMEQLRSTVCALS